MTRETKELCFELLGLSVVDTEEDLGVRSSADTSSSGLDAVEIVEEGCDKVVVQVAR